MCKEHEEPEQVTNPGRCICEDNVTSGNMVIEGSRYCRYCGRKLIK